MKTITDAVNELKGELRGDVSHVISNNVGDIAYWHDDAPITLLGRCWSIICTDAEFYVHVAELTGRPIKLKQWQDSKMNKTIKDAYEALKGDLGNSRQPLSSDRFIYFDKDKDVYICFYGNRQPKRKYQYICTVEEFINYGKSIEEVKLVYTKAMEDAGEQIKAGMKFHTEAGEYIAELVNDLSVCFTDEYGFFVGVSIHAIKGIDTRTDKEKAIDAELVSCTGYNDNIRNALSNAYDKWVK